MTITTPAPEIQRDRYGRPLVIGPSGGKPLAYTRCTTFVDCIEDKFNLQQWENRMVALGLVERADLRLAIAAHRDDKKAINGFCNEAKEAAKAHAAATTGTALHKLCENLDRGLDLGTIPIEYQADLDAYVEATKDLKATHIETFCVLDSLKIGGTPDRVVRHEGKSYIADIKTGSIEWGTYKIAMQLAVYARSKTYDIATGERGMHGAELDKGLIIHLPAGTGTADLVWVDLLEGWNGVLLARQVREKRTLKFKDLTTPFTAASVPMTLEAQIKTCTTADAVRALWAENSGDWTEELSQVAKAHIAGLPSAS